MPLIASGVLATDLFELTATRGNPGYDATPYDIRAARSGTIHDSFWLSKPIEEVLAARRAVRRFTDEPVSADVIAGIAHRALMAEQEQWPAGVHGPHHLTMLLAAFRVEGLTRALHRVSTTRMPSGAPWSAVAPAPDDLREVYADAPALLLICGNIATAGTPGDQGYGSLLMRCGTLGYAAWLAAVDAGLAGCAYGGPHHLMTATADRLEAGSRHLFTISIGHEALSPDIRKVVTS